MTSILCARLRSVTAGYTLWLHSFSLFFNTVTLVTLQRAHAHRTRCAGYSRLMMYAVTHPRANQSVTSVTTLIYKTKECNHRV